MSAKKSAQQHDRARQPPDHLVVGRVVRPHGVRGALVVLPESQVLASLQPGATIQLGDSEREYTIENIRPHRKRFLISVEGIHDRNQAEEYRDLEVKLSYEESEPLAEHEYYYWQILGMHVETQAGKHLGEVVDIIETGANDVYIVQAGSGEQLLLPAIEDVILEVDLDQNRLRVHLLPGLQTD